MKPRDRLEVYPVTGVEVITWRGHTIGVLLPDISTPRWHWVVWALEACSGSGATHDIALMAACEALRVLDDTSDNGIADAASDLCQLEGHAFGDNRFAVTPTLTKVYCDRCGRWRFTDGDIVP